LIAVTERSCNVLFLCTGNSARSIIAECVLNRVGHGRFRAYSAGSSPSGAVHPEAVQLLGLHGFETAGLRSKSWDEFAVPGAPLMDFVFTVCDRAAGETCPLWPGQPIRAHWPIPDPAAVEGSEAQRQVAFADVFRILNKWIDAFARLPIGAMDKLSLQRELEQIGSSSA
jgi:protein-tyrosine-phosphatase